MSRDVERYREAKAAAASRDLEALARALAASMRAAADKLEAAIGEFVADLERMGVTVEDLAAAMAAAEQSPEPRRQAPPPARSRVTLRPRHPSQVPVDPKPRTCVVCGEQFRRRPGEPLWAFQKRQTCQDECKRALLSRRAQQSRTSRRVNPDTKTCVACGSEFGRRDDERLNDFRRRSTCSRECRRNAIAASMRRRASSPPPPTPTRPTPPPPPPPPPPREPRVPEPPIPVPPPAIEAEEPWQPPQRHEPVRLQPLGEACPEHPGEVIGVFGCPACNAGRKWRERGQVARVGVGSRP